MSVTAADPPHPPSPPPHLVTATILPEILQACRKDTDKLPVGAGRAADPLLEHLPRGGIVKVAGSAIGGLGDPAAQAVVVLGGAAGREVVSQLRLVAEAKTGQRARLRNAVARTLKSKD